MSADLESVVGLYRDASSSSVLRVRRVLEGGNMRPYSKLARLSVRQQLPPLLLES